MSGVNRSHKVYIIYFHSYLVGRWCALKLTVFQNYSILVAETPVLLSLIKHESAQLPKLIKWNWAAQAIFEG